MDQTKATRRDPSGLIFVVDDNALLVDTPGLSSKGMVMKWSFSPIPKWP